MTFNFKVFGDYANGLPQAIDHATSRDSNPYARRKKLAFKSFSSFIASNYEIASPNNINYICMHFRSHVYSNRGEKSIISANSDYLAWANLMKDLIRMRSIPRCTVPKGLKSSHPILRISDKMNCLGSMNPKLWKREFHEASFTELQAIADQDYLTLFYEHQLEYRDKLVSVARSYIREASERFNKGKQYIQSSVPEDFAHPNLLHPTIKILDEPVL